jgi:LysR family glycine cleavage system transcriptional activator
VPVPPDLLRTFVTAARAGTFSRAAARQRVTKSAVSQQIRALEAHLGTRLFERSGKGVRLTEAGEALADVLERELAAIDEALDAVVSSRHQVAGHVRIGSPGPFTRIWLRPRVADLLRAHADLRLTVSFGTPRELESRLVERELDMILLVRPVEAPGLAETPVFTEYFRAYAASSYLQASPALAVLDDLARHRFIVYGDDLPMHAPWWRAAAGARRPFAGTIVCSVANLYEMRALAERGIGIVVLPDYFAAEAVKRGTLTELPRLRGSRAAVAVNRIVLAWRTSAIPTGAFRAVRDALCSGVPAAALTRPDRWAGR